MTDRSLRSVEGPPKGGPPPYQRIPNRPFLDTGSSITSFPVPAWLSSRTARTNFSSDDTWKGGGDETTLPLASATSSAVLPMDRGQNVEQELTTLMLSARGQAKDVEMAERAGANRYMTKPFSNSEVLEAVRALVPA